ncbi:MAG: Fic family protein [Lentisphaerae bacterium]|nr:Fic family protein [Lentisphaerota bacterium]
MPETFILPPLPPKVNLETHAVLKRLIEAHRHLAELKGVAATIPNEDILIQTLALQEAKDSSEVENIVTTHDELFKADLESTQAAGSAKEVARYVAAVRVGFNAVRQTGLITVNQLIAIQQTLENNNAGIRKLPGTTLRNLATNEVIYTPPQSHAEIIALMSDLESFINDPSCAQIDPLVKMALIHYQFESIHPFYDGNGRTGRILNILYLVANGLLNLPILYLSRYIIHHKAEYYHKLQAVRTSGAWEEWILFILDGVIATSVQTIRLVAEMRTLMLSYKHRIRQELPRIYSQDLLNNLFRHPYTKIEFLQNDLKVSRATAARYLDQLVAAGLLTKRRHSRSNYYVNTALVTLLVELPPL